MIRLRKTLAALAVWLPVIVVGATWLLWGSQLPTQLPTHWEMSGSADSVGDTATQFWISFVIAALAAIVATVTAIVPAREGWSFRAICGYAGGVGAFMMAIWLTMAVPSLGVTDPYSVILGPWMLLLLVAPAYGFIPLLLFPRPGTPREVALPTQKVPALDLSPTATASWSTTIFSWLFAGATLLVAILALVIPQAMQPGTTVWA